MGPFSRGEGSPVPPGNGHPHTNRMGPCLGRIDGQYCNGKFSYMQIILDMKMITLQRLIPLYKNINMCSCFEKIINSRTHGIIAKKRKYCNVISP